MVQVNYNQVVSFADRLSLEERQKLARYLDKETVTERFLKLREQLKDTPITEEEINREVEIVREERFRAGLH